MNVHQSARDQTRKPARNKNDLKIDIKYESKQDGKYLIQHAHLKEERKRREEGGRRERGGVAAAA